MFSASFHFPLVPFSLNCLHLFALLSYITWAPLYYCRYVDLSATETIEDMLLCHLGLWDCFVYEKTLSKDEVYLFKDKTSCSSHRWKWKRKWRRVGQCRTEKSWFNIFFPTEIELVTDLFVPFLLQCIRTLPLNSVGSFPVDWLAEKVACSLNYKFIS